MAAGVAVRRLSPDEAANSVDALADILVDCVEGGASVSFMAPLAPAKAAAFWRGVARDVAAGSCVLFVAETGAGAIVGTVQILFGQPENQPHRADIAKMLVHRAARRLGVGAALMQAAEATALQEGKTLLVLDTASDDAERLYARLGWSFVGSVPGYALMPDGRPCDTKFFYKILA